MNFSMVLMIAALVLFIIGAIVPVGYRYNLVAAGLACATAAQLLGGGLLRI